MIGSQSSNRGRSPEVEDEELLNVIRRSENKEVPTRDIADAPSITIGYEAVRTRLNELESQNRVISRSAGKLRMWQLGELETDEPVREPPMGKAHRWANRLREFGKSFALVAIGFAFASVLFFIMFLHAQAGQITPPLLSQDEIIFAGYVFGYIGAFMGVLAGIVYGVELLVPRVAAWRLEQLDAATNTSEES